MKKVIYTVLTGNYDHLQQPVVQDSAWDYVCFTDGREGRDGVWQLRSIPWKGSQIMRARWAKLHPHLLLEEYDYSVFMDANLCIASEEFYRWLEPCPVLGVLPHPERDCVWEELRYCYLKDKISTRAACRWHRRLGQMGMPRHAGLEETNILARRHGSPEVVALDEKWWSLLQESGGTRDQLVLRPALFQLGMEPELLFGPGRNARNVPFIQYVNHPPTGRENVPGKLNWANLKYHLRLLWRKTVLPWLK